MMHKYWTIAVGCALSVGMGVAEEVAGLDESSEEPVFIVAQPGIGSTASLLAYSNTLLEWNEGYAVSGDEVVFLDPLDTGMVNLSRAIDEILIGDDFIEQEGVDVDGNLIIELDIPYIGPLRYGTELPGFLDTGIYEESNSNLTNGRHEMLFEPLMNDGSDGKVPISHKLLQEANDA